MGIGGNVVNMIPAFLDPKLHAAGAPLDFASVHYYSGSGGKDGDAYAHDMFRGADGFIDEMRKIILPYRDESGSPATGIDVDELGVLGDGAGCAPPPGYKYPEVYWNAAGAMYAYIFGQLVLDGVEVLGQSQLMGSPAIPEWGVPISQFPGVSLLSWETGYGNAKYWALKLLLEHFAPGDKLFKTAFAVDGVTPRAAAAVTDCAAPGVFCGVTPFCGQMGSEGAKPLTLTCLSPAATISAVVFADYGGSVGGSCGRTPAGGGLYPADAGYKSNVKCVGKACCSSAANTTAWVTKTCVGKHSCVLDVSAQPDPCVGVAKTLAMEVACSDGHGGTATPSALPLLPQPAPGPPPPPAVFPPPSGGHGGGGGGGSWCGEATLHGPDYYGGTWYLRCTANATMTVEWAEYGDVKGSCAAGFASALNCSSAQAATAYVRRQCDGRNGCLLEPSHMGAVQGLLPAANKSSCPYLGERAIVRGRCSDGRPAQSTPCVPWLDFLYKTCIIDQPASPNAAWPYDATPTPTSPLYALGFAKPDGKTKKILMVNKGNSELTTAVPAGKWRLSVVDPSTVGMSSPQGIREDEVEAAAESLALLPFAVAVLTSLP